MIQISKASNNHIKDKKIQLKDLPEYWKDADGKLQHHDVFYILQIIETKLINRHHNNLLAGHFNNNENRELVAKKYYQ